MSCIFQPLLKIAEKHPISHQSPMQLILQAKNFCILHKGISYIVQKQSPGHNHFSQQA